MDGVEQQAQRIAKMVELHKAMDLLLEAGLVFAASKLKWPLRTLTLEFLAYHEPAEDRAIRKRLAIIIHGANLQPIEDDDEDGAGPLDQELPPV